METKYEKGKWVLVSAASEMYEALVKIKSMCDGNKDNENNIWHIANEALKKATE